MKILGLDSSGIVASVAVVEDDILVAEYTVNYKKTHSQTLLPMLDEIAKMTELDLNTIDAIAVAAGPGSFTGLRIGSATAKGLGLALKKPLVAVPTVEGLAYNLYDTQGLICPIMDARRKQVYTGIYRFEAHRLVTVEDQMAVPMEELITKLNAYQQPVTFLGFGVTDTSYNSALVANSAMRSVNCILNPSSLCFTITAPFSAFPTPLLPGQHP